MQHLHIDGLKLTVPYLYLPYRRQCFHYRRAVPKDLQHHYSQRVILKSLRTGNKAEAALACIKLNNHIEQEFTRLRAGLDKMSTVASFRAVKQHQYRSGEQTLALEALNNAFRPPASDYPSLYISTRKKEKDRKFKNKANAAMAFLLAALPDKAPADYTRSEINTLLSHHQAAGKLGPTSIDRHLRTLRAMFNAVSLEFDLTKDREHVFINLHFPQLETLDETDRQEFSQEQQQTLRTIFDSTRQKSTAMLMMGLLLDTGLRMNEACGLRWEDVYLEAPCPYISIHKNPFRRLKTKHSRRHIPLVGTAYKALATLKKQLGASQWVFEKYIQASEQTTRNDAASKEVNLLLRQVLGPECPTSYGFRHALATRLRNNGCPIEIMEQLGGWTKSISSRYGSATLLEKQRYFLRQDMKNYFYTTYEKESINLKSLGKKMINPSFAH